VYRWKDSSGVWNYSDQPHPGAELIRRPSGSSTVSSSPAPAAAQVAPATATSDQPLPVSKEVADQVRKESADAKAELCKKTTADYQKYVQAPLIYKTDAEGKAHLTELPLGPTELKVYKRAFSKVTKNIVVGWGSNPLPEQSLHPEGDQHVFTVTDVFSGKPLANALATAGEADATSNAAGELTLTIDAGDDTQIPVIIKAEGYRTETVTLQLLSIQIQPNHTK
jgi:hypothetical protein